MHLAIVSVCFADKDGLARTGESIGHAFMSQGERIEWVVVDGSASEGVRKCAEDLAERFEFLRLIYCGEPDRGVDDAMNKGTALTSAPFVQYLNSGDTYLPDADPTALLAKLRTNPVWVIAGAVHGFGTGRPVAVIGNRPHRWLRHALGLQSHCHQACWFRRDIVIALGGYAEDLSFVADHHMITRVGIVAPPEVLTEILIFYEGGGLSAELGMQIPELLRTSRARSLWYNDAVVRYIDQAFTFGQRGWRRARLTWTSRRRYELRDRHTGDGFERR